MAVMEQPSAARIHAWLESVPREDRERLFLLLDELCAGLDVSRHNQFGFLRLRAEFETSGELFGCTIAELGDVSHLRPPRSPSPLEELRAQVGSQGHPDFR
jgi:hypothetical protein